MESASQAIESASQATESASQAIESASQAAESASQEIESASQEIDVWRRIDEKILAVLPEKGENDKLFFWIETPEVCFLLYPSSFLFRKKIIKSPYPP